jgi:HEAT repeat protein
VRRDPRSGRQALGNFQDKRLADTFLAMLSGDDAKILKRVAVAIGRIGDPRAERPLLKLLDHPDAGVREAAAEALGAVEV